MKRTPEQRAETAAAKREAPHGIRPKQAKVDMQVLPFAPPAPRVREAKGIRNGLKTYTRLGSNPERRAAKRIETHGTHADWVSTLPCCVCMPEHFHAPLKPFLFNEHNKGSVISDPHHVGTRGAGWKRNVCVPLCRLHHDQAGAWGPDSFDATYRVGLTTIALLLWEQSSERER
jgi:hypothetical protein